VTSKIACCGQGPYNGIGLCTPASNLCPNRDLYAFWDPFHPSEKANRIIVQQILRGTTEYMHPMNLTSIMDLDSMTWFIVFRFEYVSTSQRMLYLCVPPKFVWSSYHHSLASVFYLLLLSSSDCYSLLEVILVSPQINLSSSLSFLYLRVISGSNYFKFSFLKYFLWT